MATNHKNHNPIFPQLPDNGLQTFENADSTDRKLLYTAGDEGAIISAISATSDDSADKWLQLSIYDGSSDYYPIGEIKVEDGVGTNQTDVALNVLDSTSFPWLPDDNTILLKPGYSLAGNMQAAVTAAKTIWVVVFAGDYDDGS